MPGKKTPPRLPPRPRPTGRPNPGLGQPRPVRTPSEVDTRFRGNREFDSPDRIDGVRDPDVTNMTVDQPAPEMPREYKMRRYLKEKKEEAAKPPKSLSPRGTPAPSPSPRPMPTPVEPTPTSPSRDPKQSSMRMREALRRRRT